MKSAAWDLLANIKGKGRHENLRADRRSCRGGEHEAPGRGRCEEHSVPGRGILPRLPAWVFGEGGATHRDAGIVVARRWAGKYGAGGTRVFRRTMRSGNLRRGRGMVKRIIQEAGPTVLGWRDCAAGQFDARSYGEGLEPRMKMLVYRGGGSGDGPGR